MAGALGGGARLPGSAPARCDEVLLPGDAAVSVRPTAHGPRAQLLDRGCRGPLPVDARTPGAPPDGLGLLWPAGGERGHPAWHAPGDLDQPEHRRHGAAAPAARSVV